MRETANAQMLNQELQELQQQYDLLSENIRSLNEDYHNTLEAHEKLPLERKLNAEKARRAEIEQQLRSVSERLDTLNQNKLVSEKVWQHLQYLEATMLVEELQEKIKQQERQQRELKTALTEKQARIQELETLLKQKDQHLRKTESSTDFFEQHKEGDVVNGVIKTIHPQHGIFVELAPGVTGLARRENLDKTFKQQFNEGEKIPVRIERLNKQERKIELLIKAYRPILDGKQRRRS